MASDMTIGDGSGWYVIEYPLSRTGVMQVDYTNAPNYQAASEFNPGTTVLGGPYKTQAAAENAFLGSSTGQQYLTNPHSPPPANTDQQSILPPWEAIGKFFNLVTQRKIWIQVGEVLAGSVILYAGLKATLTGQAPAQTVGRAATAPARVAKRAGKTAVTVAAPEVRVARRVAAKRVAPKTTARVARHREYVRQYGAKRPYSPRGGTR